MADPPAGRFFVNVTTERLDELRRLNRAAVAAGHHVGFLRSVREVNYRLKHEADEWGEGRIVYPGGRVELRVGVAGELAVWYSVDLPRGVVYVKRFRLRGDPAAGPEGAA